MKGFPGPGGLRGFGVPGQGVLIGCRVAGQGGYQGRGGSRSGCVNRVQGSRSGCIKRFQVCCCRHRSEHMECTAAGAGGCRVRSLSRVCVSGCRVCCCHTRMTRKQGGAFWGPLDQESVPLSHDFVHQVCCCHTAAHTWVAQRLAQAARCVAPRSGSFAGNVFASDGRSHTSCEARRLWVFQICGCACLCKNKPFLPDDLVLPPGFGQSPDLGLETSDATVLVVCVPGSHSRARSLPTSTP